MQAAIQYALKDSEIKDDFYNYIKDIKNKLK
jgi:hypothetical protein